MPQILFLAADGEVLARVAGVAGDVLLDLARAHAVPLHWRCGQGTCGTCRVRLQHDAQPGLRTVTPKERNVMLRHGLLPPTAANATHLPDSPTQWRLACHLVLSDADWTVLLPPPA